MNTRLGLATLTLAAAMLAGCSDDPTAGYTTQSLHRPGIRSVAVEMFDRGRNVYRRELETRLTEAVVKRIQYDTRYKIADRATADTVLTGQIDVIEQAIIHVNPHTGRPREKELSLAVSLVWKDLRTGKELARVNNLRGAVTYLPEPPLNEVFFQGAEDEINRLARRIVEQMERPW